jgi:hypothetical protein
MLQADHVTVRVFGRDGEDGSRGNGVGKARAGSCGYPPCGTLCRP